MIPVRDRSPGNWVYWCDGSLESYGKSHRGDPIGISAGPPGDGHKEGRGGEEACFTRWPPLADAGRDVARFPPDTSVTGSRSWPRRARGRITEKILFYPIDMTDSKFA